MAKRITPVLLQSKAGSTVIRLWALLVGIGLLMAGNGLQGSLLGVVAEDTGFSSGITGLVMTAFYVGFLLGSTSAQRLIGLVGHVRTFAALASISSVAILVHGLQVDPWTWMAMRFATGFSFAGLYVVAESWLNKESTDDFRGTLLAIYMIVVHAGLAAGQGMLNFAPTAGLELYVLSSIVLSAALVPILVTAAPQPTVEPVGEAMTLRRLFSISPLGSVGCFISGIANGIILGMAAVYARKLGLGTGTVSAFVAAIMIGGAVFQWPIGKLSDVIDRRKVIAGVAALVAVSAALLHLFSGSFTLLVVFGAITGGFALTLYPLCLSYTNDWLTSDQMVAGSSSMVMAYGVGAILGPLGTGLLMGVMGPFGFVLYLVILGIVFAAFTLLRIYRGTGPRTSEDYLVAPAVLAAGEYYRETAVEESTDDPEASPA